MFATRCLRSVECELTPIVKELMKKATVVNTGLPAATPRGFAVRGENGVVIPVKSEAEYIAAVSTDAKLKNLLFAGAGMKHYDDKRFNSETLKHLTIASVFGLISAVVYKVHNNAMMRDYRSDYPKFDYIAEKARAAAAAKKAALAEE